MTVTLGAIAFLASAMLSAVFVFTAEPIRKVAAAKVDRAIGDVLPPFDNSPAIEMTETKIDGRTLRLYPARKDSRPVGIAVETSTGGGFGGEIRLMVGFLPDGRIYKTAVLSHAETPGLGDKIDARRSTFSLQFEGKDPATFNLAVRQDGGDVDAITAATISSRAFCDAVERAKKVIRN
ncbi:MAG: RnfABCDGE type electron transport complex subunit G [Prevotellaceae bacterium]|nr:RnfABCDGE type electron transport complex subunit G [Prevotellaceae bacterium]